MKASLLVAIFAATVFAQTTAGQLQFEVARIKPMDPNATVHRTGINIYPGGRLLIPGVTLRSLITTAFGVSYWQMSGAEPWIEKEQYDLEAIPPTDIQPAITNLRHGLFDIDDQRLREMLQALIVDRFHLTFHRETRTGKIYLLVKRGSTVAIHSTDDGSVERRSPGDSNRSSIGFAGDKWNMFNTSMPQLAKWASDIIVHAPVLDRTELGGHFDYRQTTRLLDSEVDYGSNSEGPFFIFLQEMGLKLQEDKGPVEYFVIDHAEKATPN